MADYAVQPLDGAFGAEVTGLDLSRDVEPSALAGLRRLFHERQLMVVRGQEITPQRFLWFARAFGDGEARPLLDRLAEHAAQDRFVHAHSYRVGDVVLWDNFSLMHRATLIDRASGLGTRRYMHRISTKDLPAAP